MRRKVSRPTHVVRPRSTTATTPEGGGRAVQKADAACGLVTFTEEGHMKTIRTSHAAEGRLYQGQGPAPQAARTTIAHDIEQLGIQQIDRRDEDVEIVSEGRNAPPPQGERPASTDAHGHLPDLTVRQAPQALGGRDYLGHDLLEGAAAKRVSPLPSSRRRGEEPLRHLGVGVDQEQVSVVAGPPGPCGHVDDGEPQSPGAAPSARSSPSSAPRPPSPSADHRLAAHPASRGFCRRVEVRCRFEPQASSFDQ